MALEQFQKELTIDADLQSHFADITRDFNPMHVDPVAARRTQYGFPVVHGIHGLLWALNEFASVYPSLRPTGLHAHFTNAILVGETMRLSFRHVEDKNQYLLEIHVGDLLCQTIRLFDTSPAGVPDAIELEDYEASEVIGQAADLDFDAMVGRSGGFNYSADQVAEHFAHAASSFGSAGLVGLAASTYIVGMECPGLHSIYSEIRCAFDKAPPSESSEMLVKYKVSKTYWRFRMVEISMSLPGFRAKLGTFARMPPVAQPSSAQLAALVIRDAFKGQRAFVVGGSRGLGEVTAKLLAMGGADVIFSYASGEKDALAVVDDIVSNGGSASAVRYDLRAEAKGQIEGLRFSPNTTYYFATSPIFRKKTEVYSSELMKEFLKFYVEGFHDLCLALNANVGELVAFYPSSVFAETATKGFAEYGGAKLAGEMLCQHLNEFVPGITAISRRLPRAVTDQTATVTPTNNVAPEEIMIPILKAIQDEVLKANQGS